LAQRYFIEIAYRGTAYHGWQIQQNALGIQQLLNEKLSLKLGEEIYCIGCGRTDTGVHARQFYLHLDVNKDIPADFIRQMNNFLPADIALHRIFPVPEKAHSRFSAVERTYTYILSLEKDPFMLGLSGFYYDGMDLESMNEAAGILTEFSDFTALCKISKDQKNNLCSIKAASWRGNGKLLVFTITANRFLRGMVRILVGTLMEIGKGRMSVSAFRELLSQQERTQAGSAAPAEGLYLTEVKYPDWVFALIA
jgi:tRNA pseudouridine38-40 synthase